MRCPFLVGLLVWGLVVLVAGCFAGAAYYLGARSSSTTGTTASPVEVSGSGGEVVAPTPAATSCTVGHVEDDGNYVNGTFLLRSPLDAVVVATEQGNTVTGTVTVAGRALTLEPAVAGQGTPDSLRQNGITLARTVNFPAACLFVRVAPGSDTTDLREGTAQVTVTTPAGASSTCTARVLL